MALDCALSGIRRLLATMIVALIPVNLSAAKGNFLLMLAAYHGHEETVRTFIGHSVELDRRNDHGQPPLGSLLS